MEALIRRLGTIRLRKIDVMSWDSPISKQCEIRQLPTLWLYEGGDLISDDTQEVLEILQGGS